MSKKILAALLAVLMVVSLVPVTAFAAVSTELDVTVSTDGTVTVKEGDAEYTSTDGTLKYALVTTDPTETVKEWDDATTEDIIKSDLDVPDSLAELDSEVTLTADDNGYIVVVDIKTDDSTLVACGVGEINIQDDGTGSGGNEGEGSGGEGDGDGDDTPAASNDATLATVLGQNITAGSEAGTADAPKTAAITVAYATEDVTPADIAATDENATVELYSDSAFGDEVESEITLTAGEDTVVYIKVTAEDGETILYYAVTIKQEAPKTDATIKSAKVGNYTATLPETTSDNATDPKDITVDVPADTDLSDVIITLTVDPTATVKTSASQPSNESDYSTDTANTNGTVTISEADLSSDLYVMVIAQDGTTKCYYKIVADESDIIAGSVDEADTNYGDSIDEDAKTEIDSAFDDTALVADEVFAAAAFEAVNANADEYSEDAAKAALDNKFNVGDDIYIHAIPYLEVTATEYDVTESTYTVDIAPKVKVVAATVASNPTEDNSVTMDTLDVTFNEAVDVEIGIPTGIANDNDFVSVNHDGKETFIKKVESNKVTVTVTSFSPFTVTKLANAVLSSLVLDPVPSGFTFDPAEDTYNVNVANSVESIRVTPTAGDASWTITVADAGVTSGATSEPIDLVVGANTITIVVEATGTSLQDMTYTINITRAASGGGSGSGSSGGSSSTTGSITVTQPANGTVTSSVTNAKEGDKVTVTVTPNESYYVVTGVTVRGDNGTVTATKNADGTYSFTMPAGTVSVSATIVHMYDLFTDISNAVSSIPEYGTAIKWAVEQGITVGTSTSTFSPYNPCTRAQMVVFLYRAAGSPAVSGTNSFTDVPSDNEIQKAVQWAVNKNISQGTSATTFDPYAPCTRAQMVTFLHRNNGEAAATGSNNFADVPADAYYKTAIQWAVNEGITKGYSDTAFGPSDACTRVQMVTFLYRDMAK